jgi:hypothetical protein
MKVFFCIQRAMTFIEAKKNSRMLCYSFLFFHTPSTKINHFFICVVEINYDIKTHTYNEQIKKKD